jgi:hypothetical protein
MFNLNKEINLEELFRFRPINPGDPGPEIYQTLVTLPEERQRAIFGVVNEAVGQIAAIKGNAYSKISGMISGREQE